MWTEEQTNLLITHYPNYGAKYCSSLLGYTQKQICNRLHYLRDKGIKLLLTKQARSLVADRVSRPKPPHLCNINPDIFTNPCTKELVYLLGYLWADGYINKNIDKNKKKRYIVSLQIQHEDFLSIENIIDITGKWNKWKRKESNNNGVYRKAQQTVITSNKIIHNFLLKYNYGYKYKNPTILSIIPNNQHYYWFRGYFVGDGCFYCGKSSKQISISSCYQQDWSFMKDLCKQLSIKYSIQRLKRNATSASSSFRITNKIGIITFGNYIYKNYDNIGLKRKYNKFQKILSLSEMSTY
jgi:hypothetical protein